MKRQRNTAQMKEQTRSTEAQINEEEMCKLPEKEFRIMIVKMIKNFENKMEKMQESINKELELKNKHTETNNKHNKSTNPVISRQDYHLTQPCPSEENKTKLSTNLSLYEAYTNHWTNFRRAETKRNKELSLLQGNNSTFLEA